MRELAPSDLDELAGPRPKGVAVAKFWDSHHMMARLFAMGLSVGEVAERTGRSHNRASTLRNDPSFQELIAHYRELVTESMIDEVADYAAMATKNMLKAERQISDRLDEADAANETLPVRELVAISRDAADRFGFGKRQTNVNLNVDFAGQLDRAIKRSGKVIDASPQAVGSSGGAAPSLAPALSLVPAHSSRAGSGGAQVAFETSPSQSKARANGSPVHHQPSVRRI